MTVPSAQRIWSFQAGGGVHEGFLLAADVLAVAVGLFMGVGWVRVGGMMVLCFVRGR